MTPFGTDAEFNKIIENRQLTPVFQPIVDTGLGSILGYEALIRGPEGSVFHSPEALFKTANVLGRLAELEHICREVSCRIFKILDLPGKLFLNISPMVLLAKEHRAGETRRILDKIGLSAQRVVIEISEHYPLEDYRLIREATHYYRDMGFEIAIDDLGSGYAGLKIWSELRPDYVKIDRHFIANLHEDPIKREFVRSINDIGRSMGCRIIAEGIETEAELIAVRKLGIEFQQGFFLSHPLAHPPLSLDPELITVSLREKYSASQLHESKILELLVSTESVSPESTLESVHEIFCKNPALTSLPVCNGGCALGVVSRNDVLEKLSSRFGRDLYARKSAERFISPHSLLVDVSTPISQVSRVITDNPSYDLNLDFVLTSGDQYLGMAKPRALLRRITEQQVRSARYCNPLTQLPGNVPLHETIDEFLHHHQDFNIAYCDLNHFKPYNDTFGYSRGDEVILRVSELIQEHIHEKLDLLFHIGGDDLIIIFRDRDWLSSCEQILKDFDRLMERFYPEEILREGGIWGENRRGEEQFFPLLSLAIGVVNPDTERCMSHHDIAALAADAKHQAKRPGGNQLFISRRRGPYSRGRVRPGEHSIPNHLGKVSLNRI